MRSNKKYRRKESKDTGTCSHDLDILLCDRERRASSVSYLSYLCKNECILTSSQNVDIKYNPFSLIAYIGNLYTFCLDSAILKQTT